MYLCDDDYCMKQGKEDTEYGVYEKPLKELRIEGLLFEWFKICQTEKVSEKWAGKTETAVRKIHSENA